jgi:hypothetical protein
MHLARLVWNYLDPATLSVWMSGLAGKSDCVAGWRGDVEQEEGDMWVHASL